MNSRLYRVLAGFLGVFVVISLAPRAPMIADAVVSSAIWPAAWAAMTGFSLPTIDLTAVLTSPLLDPAAALPLIVASMLTLLLLGSMTRRHLLARGPRPRRAAGQVTRHVIARTGDARVARARKDDSLGAKIRQAATQGERAPALARRFGVSQDAIRTATGRAVAGGVIRSARTSPSRPRGSELLSRAGGPSASTGAAALMGNSFRARTSPAGSTPGKRIASSN